MRIRIRDMTSTLVLCTLTVHDENDVEVEFHTTDDGTVQTLDPKVVTAPLAKLSKETDENDKESDEEEGDPSFVDPTLKREGEDPPPSIVKDRGKRWVAAECKKLEMLLEDDDAREAAREEAGLPTYASGPIHSRMDEADLDRIYAVLLRMSGPGNEDEAPV